jgi:hypothetical protein
MDRAQLRRGQLMTEDEYQARWERQTQPRWMDHLDGEAENFAEVMLKQIRQLPEVTIATDAAGYHALYACGEIES